MYGYRVWNRYGDNTDVNSSNLKFLNVYRSDDPGKRIDLVIGQNVNGTKIEEYYCCGYTLFEIEFSATKLHFTNRIIEEG